MYYNSNRVNNDYYNAYKKEVSKLQNEHKIETIKSIIKYILFFLVLLFLLLASFYLYHYFNPKIESKESLFNQKTLYSQNQPSTTSITIKEEDLPVSIQLIESDIEPTKSSKLTNTTNRVDQQNVVSSVNKRDVELIVKTIIAKMNKEVEIPLEKQLQEVNDKVVSNKTLQEVDHYNKVVLTESEVVEVQNSPLNELNNNLQTIVNEVNTTNSNYTQEITKEVVYRENEMRIIIVQKGDTLSKIAKKAYGDYANYKKIFAANPEIIENPNQIYVGQRLRIPS